MNEKVSSSLFDLVRLQNSLLRIGLLDIVLHLKAPDEIVDGRLAAVVLTAHQVQLAAGRTADVDGIGGHSRDTSCRVCLI